MARSPMWGGPDLLTFEAREPVDSLTSRNPVRVNLPLPSGDVVLEVTVDLPWVPRLLVDGSEDARELGIGLEDVQLRNEPAEEPGARSPWIGVLNRLRALAQPPALRP